MVGSVDVDGFEDYIVDTNETPVSYIIVVGLFVALSLALAAPCACWSRERVRRSKIRGQTLAPSGGCSNTEGHECLSHHNHSHPDFCRETGHVALDALHHHNHQPPALEESHSPNVADLAIFHHEHLVAMKQMANERRLGKLLYPASSPQICRDPMVDPKNADKLSSIRSGASGNVLRQSFRPRMPWNHGRPLPRSETVQRFVRLEQERQSQASEEGSHHSLNSRSRNSWIAGQAQPARARIVSEAAGNFLDGQAVEGEAEYYRQKYMQRSTNYGRHARRPSLETGSDVGSVMPPLDSDAVSPRDAADNSSIGVRSNPNQYKTHETLATDPSSQSHDTSGTITSLFLIILDLAEPDYVGKRILELAIPTTISALADPIYRIVLVAIISHFIDTDSMVAYLLVILFIRLTTEEISGAITQAESNMVQDACLEGGDPDFYQAGQTIQMAILFQLAIGVPVLLMWYFVMEGVVNVLVDNADIAQIAAKYTGVIIIDYTLRGVSRSFMLPFYWTKEKHEVAQFEAKVDLMATFMTGVAIAIVVTTNDLSLEAIGWIQVIIGFAKVITKVAYISLRGWLQPFKGGLLTNCACKHTASAVNFLLQAFPLFLGSLLELGEWEFLVLFIGHMGGAEVATWAMMGVIWEIFSALAEGLGEAASVLVSFYLTQDLPMEAERVANKVAFFATILVLVVTSIFLMAGPNIAVILSTDSTIQHLFTQMVGLTGLANVAMTLAHVHWSLAGELGRIGLASATILFCRWLVILPVASICIFGYNLDLVAVSGAVAVGYAVAAFTLAWFVFQKDLELLSLSLREDEAMDVGGGGGAFGSAFQEEDEEDEPSSVDDESSEDESEDTSESSSAAEEESEKENEEEPDDHELL